MPAIALTEHRPRCVDELGRGEVPGPLVGPRLLLRNYEPSDAEEVCQAIQETRTTLLRWVPDIGRHQTPLEVRTALVGLASSIGSGDCDVFGVWDRATNRFLGEVGLYSLDRAARLGEVGYWLRQRAQGFGHAQAAVNLLLDYASRHLGIQRFEAHVAIDNSASQRVAERLGFGLAWRRTPAARWDGQVEEVLVYALNRIQAGVCSQHHSDLIPN